ncbi:hypothetical protein DIURU_005542 [Diutina rugosa]|uniref:Uncharacterized protein n=1 Tax=Diutina rugosa TaxID=5481 RepID=A0A642UKA6_DIURU|nr:uncharacterized protein DIURU_005542 [Diutina rugosa]KAA8897029.1 hypothetical protein DIURU_005542 [Diutina rugosa]
MKFTTAATAAVLAATVAAETPVWRQNVARFVRELDGEMKSGVSKRNAVPLTTDEIVEVFNNIQKAIESQHAKREVGAYGPRDVISAFKAADSVLKETFAKRDGYDAEDNFMTARAAGDLFSSAVTAANDWVSANPEQFKALQAEGNQYFVDIAKEVGRLTLNSVTDKAKRMLY